MFSKQDLVALKAYDVFLDDHNETISDRLRADLSDDPIVGMIMASLSEEEQMKQDRLSRELQKAAIHEGKWETYTEHLSRQGIAYAQVGLKFSDWVRIITRYRDYVMELLKEEVYDDNEHLLLIIKGKNKLIDYALDVIGRTFINELKEKYIKKSEQLELALSVGKIGVWDWDIKTGHISWDTIMYQLYDLSDDEFKNRYEDFEKRVHPDDRQRVYDEVSRSIESKKDFITEFRVLHTDNSLHYLTGRAKTTYDQEGVPVRMIGTNMDITDVISKQTEIDNIKNAIYKSNLVAEFTPEGTITYVNEEFLKLMGYTFNELVGKHHSILVSSEQRESKEYKEFWQRLSEGKHHEGRYPRITKDNHIVWIKGNYNPIINTNGEVYRVLKIATDISPMMEAEQQIREFNKRLEEKVEIRTADLKASNKELEHFSYTVSHDLRAPIRAISGFAKVLDKNLEGKLDTQGQHYFDVIQENVSRMGELIDDLLAFSRMGRTEKKLIDYEMKTLVQEVFGYHTQTEDSPIINLTIGELISCLSDRDMIKHVWGNLIENAIKYSSTREQTDIIISSEAEPDRVVYKIADNGVGFEMDYVGKVFGIFQRLHDDDEFEGTGVGLAIVHRIVQRHGGEVWAESKLGEGSTFYFSLPKTLKT